MEQKKISVMDVLEGLGKANVTPNVSKVVATIKKLQGALNEITELANSGCYEETDKRQGALNEVQNILIEAQCKMCEVLGGEIQDNLLACLGKKDI